MQRATFMGCNGQRTFVELDRLLETALTLQRLGKRIIVAAQLELIFGRTRDRGNRAILLDDGLSVLAIAVVDLGEKVTKLGLFRGAVASAVNCRRVAAPTLVRLLCSGIHLQGELRESTPDHCDKLI